MSDVPSIELPEVSVTPKTQGNFAASDLSKITASEEVWRKSSSLMPKTSTDSPKDQWLRKISLVVSGDSGPGIELSELRVDFSVKKTTNMTPNLFYAKVYNLAPKTMARVIEFKHVKLSAGYQTGNFGQIFDGTVVQYVRGKETPVDTYLEIFGGDADEAINTSITAKTWPGGTAESEILKDLVRDLHQYETSSGYIPFDKLGDKIVRAVTFHGMTRNKIRELTLKYGLDFYIDDGKINIVPRDAYLPGDVVVLAPSTGLVGMPRVTPQGIEATCLLNSKLRLGGLVKINSNILTGVPFEPGTASKTDVSGNVIPGDPDSRPRPIQPIATRNQPLTQAFTSPIGIYKILLLQYVGDTRGNPWYSQIICIALKSDGGVLTTPFDAFSRKGAGAPSVAATGGRAAVGSGTGGG